MLVTDRKTDYFEKRAGGTGTTIMEHIIDEKVYNGKIAAYARVILKPGCSLGYHKHEGTSETLYILSGTAEYNDNGTARKWSCFPATLHSAPKAKATASATAHIPKTTLLLWR